MKADYSRRYIYLSFRHNQGHKSFDINNSTDFASTWYSKSIREQKLFSLFRPLNVIILTPFLMLEEASFLNDFWCNFVFSKWRDYINNIHIACKTSNFPR